MMKETNPYVYQATISKVLNFQAEISFPITC